MRTLDEERLGFGARVVMIDDLWCGATGQGAYWAVASEYVNLSAEQVLQERRADRFRIDKVPWTQPETH